MALPEELRDPDRYPTPAPAFAPPAMPDAGAMFAILAAVATPT